MENRIAFTDTIEFNAPLTLSIGSRDLPIDPPASLLHKRIHFKSDNDDYTGLQYISEDPVRRKLRVVVNGRLLASTLTGPYEEAGKIIKHDDGSIQIQLAAKYTRLNRHHAALSHS